MEDLIITQRSNIEYIADAVRNKIGTTELLTLRQIAESIADIESGGSVSSSSVVEKDVNFYDYDGTLLYSYTVEEANAMTTLPALPARDGLICQGWNWSLDDIKTHNRAVNIGAIYATDDGTTRVYIHLVDGRTSPCLGLGVNGTVTVDWGDGTTLSVLTGTDVATVVWTSNHEYANAGDYVIRLTVSGAASIIGAYEFSRLLRRSSDDADNTNYAYASAIRRAEIGSNVTIGRYAFSRCCNLEAISIPNSATNVGSDTFVHCYNLNFVSIPTSMTSISLQMFGNCTGLSAVAIPTSVTEIDSSAFSSCECLETIIIPNSVTSINSGAFSYCSSLSYIDIPDLVTHISSSLFNSCRSLSFIAFPASVNTVDSSAFSNCYAIRFYDFSNHTAVPTLSSTTTFKNMATDCEIRVPTALYDEWIAAANWSTYAANIVAV